MFKSLREEVQEMEIAHEDPAKMLHQVTKRKYVYFLIPTLLSLSLKYTV